MIGGALNYPPYEFLDKDGKPTGYNVDLSLAIAREMGLDIRINLIPSHSIFQALEDGKIDVLMGVAYTEEREKIFDFSPPHTIVIFSLFGRKDSPPITSIEAWHERDVMALKRAVINEMAEAKGWKSLTFVDSDEEMLRLLASGNTTTRSSPRKWAPTLSRTSALRILHPSRKRRRFSSIASL